MPDLLLELFSEEIPARMQTRAADDLKRLVTDALVEAGLTYESAGAFSTPRRLALTVEGLTAMSPTLTEERKGPRTDAPEKALEGFLRSTGLTKDDLEARDDKKGQVWFAKITREGRTASEIIAEVMPGIIQNFPWPKSMRWGAGSLRWVRPLHSILCVLSDEAGASVVPFEIAGISASDTTHGHRFMAPAQLRVTSFEDYQQKLGRAHVVLDAGARAETIWADATNMAFAQGLEVVEDKGLLAEVAGLVEWPVVLMGDIGADFLDLPPEVLQTSMREHQKFFSVRNPKTGRIERYVTVANRETADNGATILAGNSKVLAARLSDAKFFWENDLRTIRSVGLEGMAKPLENVTFHAKLGTQAERIDRIASLAREIAPRVGADADEAAQAARVAKADLASEMVYEFPELQGVMGRYYAKVQGLSDAVAEAAQTHYAPLGPSDDVPTEPVSVAVALADKIDTLTGFWAIDEKPTGSKDPFALRRAALGVIRIMEQGKKRIRLRQLLLNYSATLIPDTIAFAKEGEKTLEVGSYKLLSNKFDLKELTKAGRRVVIQRCGFGGNEVGDLLAFLHERLKVHLRSDGIRHDVIDACLPMPQNDDLVLLANRTRALQAFLDTEDGANLLSGYKRANNILNVEEKKDGVSYELDPDPKLSEGEAETDIFTALDQVEATIAPALEAEDFAAAMTALASLRAPIDTFFDKVTVNADSAIVRRNRLCLLNRIRVTMNRVAIFSEIEG